MSDWSNLPTSAPDSPRQPDPATVAIVDQGRIAREADCAQVLQAAWQALGAAIALLEPFAESEPAPRQAQLDRLERAYTSAFYVYRELTGQAP